MVQDKYIGVSLAISGSLAIGTSFIITKKGLIDTARRSPTHAQASENRAYLRNPIWWAGMWTMIIGEFANFAAYIFAPAILVTPLGALSVLIGAVLASLFLQEKLGHIGWVGCALCLLGSFIIVLHAPADKEITTVEQILSYATQPGFLLYCLTVLVFSLVMIYYVSPRYGTRNPLVYISICSLVGSISIMAIKGFGIALKLTFSGKNQLTHASTYVFAVVIVVCILVQMNYLNKALDTFSTNVVNPMYFVGFTTATIAASLILFQGFNTTSGTTTLSLLVGFVVTFLGVHLLNFSRKAQDVAQVENGTVGPRRSMGRMNADGSWHASGGVGDSESATLFSAYVGDAADAGFPLTRLGTHGEDEDEGSADDSDERARLNPPKRDRPREGE